jgi:hypothetical protein
MLNRSARAEVINHSFDCRERCGAVSPDISTVSFLLSRRKHLHRRFVGMDDPLCQDSFSQDINKRLKLHTGLPNPLR